jgi:hypothetical protein
MMLCCSWAAILGVAAWITHSLARTVRNVHLEHTRIKALHPDRHTGADITRSRVPGGSAFWCLVVVGTYLASVVTGLFFFAVFGCSDELVGLARWLCPNRARLRHPCGIDGPSGRAHLPLGPSAVWGIVCAMGVLVVISAFQVSWFVPAASFGGCGFVAGCSHLSKIHNDLIADRDRYRAVIDLDTGFGTIETVVDLSMRISRAFPTIGALRLEHSQQNDLPTSELCGERVFLDYNLSTDKRIKRVLVAETFGGVKGGGRSKNKGRTHSYWEVSDRATAQDVT